MCIRDSIFQGIPGQVGSVARFCEAYEPWLVTGPQQQVPDITSGMLASLFRRTAPTAAGLDAWSPAELRLIPDSQCE
eukprot:9346092-Alexandrium_andersonii.AAC.1